MQKIQSYQQQQFAYHINGQGPCLLLLHGFCEDSSIWAEFSAHFEANYTVICPDLPGFGDSEARAEISIEQMADLVHHIMELEGIESCTFVGHSMGGYVAMAFAEQYPDKLARLCLFHSHPFADAAEKKQNRQKTIEFMQKYGTAPFVRQLVGNLFSKAFIAKQRDFVEQFASKAATYPLEGLVAATRAMIERPDRAAVLAQLQLPILFIIGLLDEAIPPAFSQAQIKIPTAATALLLESVAHEGMFEAKAQTLAALEAFLEA